MFDAEIEIDDWATRNEHWRNLSTLAVGPRNRRARRSEPLILCGHGVSMRIDKGTLLIRDGLTHYPQEKSNFRFFRGDNSLPERIIMVDGSGSLTFDVLSWLGEQGVALIHVDWRGEVLSVMGNHGFAADRQKVQWQMDTCADPARRLAFSNDLVVRKLENSIVALNSALAVSPRRDAAIVKAHTAINQIKFNPPADMTCLRHIEATSARVYFGAWRGLEIRWKATGRQPIPDRWRAFETRTSIANGLKDKNVNASDPLNAMLNYAYGVLQCRLQIGAVADGFDPTIGIMHHARRDAAAYVFDLMEPERPKVDAAILAFVAANTFSGADFTIREDGVCRLSPQLARVVCALADATPSVAARH